MRKSRRSERNPRPVKAMLSSMTLNFGSLILKMGAVSLSL